MLKVLGLIALVCCGMGQMAVSLFIAIVFWSMIATLVTGTIAVLSS